MSAFDIAEFRKELSSAAINGDLDKKRKIDASVENSENEPKVARTETAPIVELVTATASAAVPVKVRCCFYCGMGNPSKSHHDVLMCNNCCHDLFTGYLNREKVMRFYGFSKAKADKIPRKTLRCCNRSVSYSYKMVTVEKAFRAEHQQGKSISLAVLGNKKKYHN